MGIQFESLTTKELVDFCMEKFCCLEVCEAVGCKALCEEEDCPLYVLLERIREDEKDDN